MPAKEGLTKVANIDVTARELDFVTRFANNWDSLREILGIMRPIRKANGTTLRSFTATVTLAQSVGEGEEIPYSPAEVEEAYKEDITVEKYAKGTSIEAINKWGADIAIAKTDEAFLNELQGNVLDRFYTFLQTGSLTGSEDTFQMAVAMAIGKVVDKFKKMRKDVTEIVVFVNTLDAYKYLGASDLSLQTAFGMQYVKDFMGASTMILSSEIPSGKVIAVPSENIDLYYTDPADSDYAKAGLVYTTDGVTNLIGFHVEGNYKTAVGEVFALLGMKLWAEYLDGIAVITVNSGNFKDLTVTATTDGVTLYGGKVASDLQSDVAINGETISGKLNFIEGGLAPSGYLAGDGYFMALTWSQPESGVTKVEVGLQPSLDSGLVDGTSDPDRTIVCKVTPSLDQKFVIVQTGDGKRTQFFDLDLEFLPQTEG
jgi:hypothetical protein